MWEVSAATTQFNFTGMGQRYGFGITAEYFITKNISARGSIIANKNYLRLSLAPLFWDYAVYLINKKPEPRGSTYRRPSSAYTRPGLFLLGLVFSDGITYHLPLTKDVYLCPYIAPIQFQLCAPETSENPNGGVMSTSFGLGVKAYRKNLVFYAGAEYSRSFLANPKTGFGYSIDASVGYVVLRKKIKKNKV